MPVSEQQKPSSLRGNSIGFTPDDHLHHGVFTMISEESFINVEAATAAGLEETNNIVMLLWFFQEEGKKAHHHSERSKDNLIEAKHDCCSNMKS